MNFINVYFIPAIDECDEIITFINNNYLKLKMKSNKLAIVALLANVKAQDNEVTKDAYDYTDHGDDWDIDFPGCGDSNQSPIDLLSMGITRHEYGYFVYSAGDDSVEKTYSNQVDASVE